MKIKASTFLLSLFVLAILIVSIAVTNSFQNAKYKTFPVSINEPNQSYPYPPAETVPPGNTITPMEGQPTFTPQPSVTPFPSIDWSPLPECQNNPLGETEWKNTLSTNTNNGLNLKLLAKRASLLSPGIGNITSEEFNTILQSASTSPSDLGKKKLLVLLLNVVTGRMSRYTEIAIPTAPDIKTVDDLLTQLEGSFAGKAVPQPYIDAALSLETGSGISQSVCAKLLITKVGNNIKSARWTGNKIQKENITINQIASIRKVLFNGVPSPNGRWMAFTSGGFDINGPIFLVNMKSGELINLIREVNNKLPEDEKLNENIEWDVVGWFPDSQQIMLGVDLRAVFIIDISSYKLQAIALVNSERIGGNQNTTLSPDGKSFVYIGNDIKAGQEALFSYDLQSNKTTRLLSLSIKDGILNYPRYSPDGKFISYIIEKGHPLTGVTYAINLYSFDTQSATTLIEGNLGSSIPTWSPDGQYLAFLKKEPDVPDIVNPDQVPDRVQANLWVVSKDKQMKQVTIIHGQILEPAWLGDGKFIAFLTHNGQIGLANIDQPGKMWQVDSASNSFPLLSSAVFIP